MTDITITPPRAQETRASLPIGSSSRCSTPERRTRTLPAAQPRLPDKAVAARHHFNTVHRAGQCLAGIVALTAYVLPLAGMWIALRPILL